MYRSTLFITVIFLLCAKTYSQCNNVNLSAARPTSASFGSAHGAYMDPSYAFDAGSNYEQTRWGATDTGQVQYVGIDLGQQYNICTVVLTFGSLDYPTSFKIQGANDTSNVSNWVDLISITNNTQSSLTVNNLPTTGTYRFVRLLDLHRVYNWSMYNVYDFEVYNRVPNSPPDVDIVYPVSGSSYLQGTSISMTATATDLDGTVSKVEYYQGNTKIGEATTAPYTFNWTGAATGDYSIKAKATDNGGAISWTDSVTISVVQTSGGWSVSGNNISNTNAGFVSVGGIPTNMPADSLIKLSVKGTVFAQKLTVTHSLWPDYVFDKSYSLTRLPALEHYIRKNKHLPDMTAAVEVERKGVDVGDNQAMLLRKIEELTLYVIDLNKKIGRQGKEIIKIKRRERAIQKK